MPYDGRFLTQVQKDLLDAAKIIRERGLAKHLRLRDGKVCVRGALAQAAMGNPQSYCPHREEPAAKKIADLIEKRGLVKSHTFLPEIHYNNLDSTTAEDMAKLCEEAAFS